MKKPIIFKYHNYREFLRDWLGYLKSNQSQLSLRNLARRSGISVSLISMIIKGERSMTTKQFEKISPFLKLDASEQSYLKQLILLIDGKSAEEKGNALKKLQRFQSYQTLHSEELEVHQYLSKWYYVVLREMINLSNFKKDANWVRTKLKKNLRTYEINESFRFLEKNGFIEIGKNGVIKAEKTVKCSEGIFKLSLSDFHKQMLKLASDSIDQIKTEERLILGHTVALTNTQFKEVKNIMIETLKKIEEISNKKNDDEKKENVYHIGLLNFPVTSLTTNEDGNDK
jgi:uncharacterized protein (TIGR02147 family)